MTARDERVNHLVMANLRTDDHSLASRSQNNNVGEISVETYRSQEQRTQEPSSRSESYPEWEARMRREEEHQRAARDAVSILFL